MGCAKFYIKSFSYCNENEELLKPLPMLLRRKLNRFDKLALMNILSVYEEGIDNVVFSSQYGEFERFFKLLEQYQGENEVSPMQFSASVHNYLVGVLALFKNLTVPYYAVSAGGISFSNGLVTAVSSGGKSLFCYCDTFDVEKSFACVVSDTFLEGAVEISFEKVNTGVVNDVVEDFVCMLNGDQKEYRANLGVFRVDD